MTQKRLIKQKIYFTKILFIILGAILIIGILFAILLNIFAPMPFACTAKMCYPQVNEGYFEVPCNMCGGEGLYLVYTGLVNFKKICSGEQIMIFQDGELIDEKIDIKECKYALHVLR